MYFTPENFYGYPCLNQIKNIIFQGYGAYDKMGVKVQKMGLHLNSGSQNFCPTPLAHV